jgi:hypothetical protein
MQKKEKKEKEKDPCQDGLVKSMQKEEQWNTIAHKNEEKK